MLYVFKRIVYDSLIDGSFEYLKHRFLMIDKKYSLQAFS